MPIQSTFKSSLVVFAEKVLEMQQAKKHVVNLHRLGRILEKKDAQKKLHKIENEVEILAYGVLHEPEEKRTA